MNTGRDYRPDGAEAIKELGAMRSAYDTLRTLGEDAQSRALRWIAERLREDWYAAPPPKNDAHDEEPPF